MSTRREVRDDDPHAAQLELERRALEDYSIAIGAVEAALDSARLAKFDDTVKRLEQARRALMPEGY